MSFWIGSIKMPAPPFFRVSFGLFDVDVIVVG